ncbi:MAG TPA: branched-chain amino acid ABC transporter permease/ATP-binding protein [Actinomycetota bacterium]
MGQVFVYLLLSLPDIGAYAMFSLGIVVIHRASKVLNLAHGAMAMVPAYVAFELSRAGIPIGIAFPLAVASGSLLGFVVERVFVRPLRDQSPTAQTVGTVAALGLTMAIAIRIWGTTPRTAASLFPPEGGIGVGANSVLRWGQLGLIGIALLCVAGFFVLFRYTDLGLWMRGAADNPRAASLMGVDPVWTTRLAWIFGGGLAAIAGILLAAVTVLHPINLTLLVLPAFVAALIGGLDSLNGALGGAAIVGLTRGMVPAIGLIPGVGSFATQVGARELVLTILAFVVMMLRGSRLSGAAHGGASFASSASGGMAPRARERSPTARAAMLASAVLLLGAPWMGIPFSVLGDAIQASIILVVAISLVLLTGWVGQISLAQATFVGIGAFTTGLMARGAGINFPFNLVLSSIIAALAAVLLGVVALRVRGLYLAVATLIFLWMSNEYLFRLSALVGVGGSSTLPPQQLGTPGEFPFFDLADRRTFYYVALAVAAAAMWAAANLRDSKTGRAFFAVRGSEMAAASLGIDVTRTKMLAFAISGLLAGAAGALVIVGQGAASPAQFDFNRSMFFLAVAVVGGLSSLGGAAAASVVFAALNELFFRVTALSGWLDIVSAGLLTVVLLGYPGGLADVPASVRRLRARVRGAGPAPAEQPVEPVEVPAAIPAAPAGARADETPLVRAAGREALPALIDLEDVTVRFGGLTAVDAVSLRVCEGEIVGLIGPNGAGKTTTFNSVSGLNEPASGTVSLFGVDVTRAGVHERAALGLARTFQVLQLFSALTVFDNLLVATHLQNPTGVLSHLVVSQRSLREEVAARDRVRQVIDYLGLHDVADRHAGGLPFGVLRMVELGRALVVGAPLVMLDEPASGLDPTETERLASLLRQIRDEVGVTMLLIEHDVRMVTSVSDYMYVLDRGALLAEGRPEDVKRDPKVIAAYLGTTAEPASAP